MTCNFVKAGFVHIPKCAGTAIRDSFFDSLSLKKTHISHISDGKSSKPWCLERGSLPYRFANNSVFISGHIPYIEMKRLGRDFIFTYLRCPYERLFSLYTFNLSRASSSIALSNDPSLIRHRNQSFFDYLCNEVKANLMSSYFASDLVVLEDLRKSNLNANIKSRLTKSVRRFDAVYSGEVSKMTTDLYEQGIMPKVSVERTNESAKLEDVFMGSTKEKLIEKLDNLCNIDCFLCETAVAIFPETNEITNFSVSAEYFMRKLESKFNIIYMS